MTKFHRLTADFAIAAQLNAADIAYAAEEGFKLIVNNRPDGESLGQPAGAEIEAAAAALGLGYCAIPFTGSPPPGAVAATAGLLEEARGPVLAYCRSGARSLTAWAMAQALKGGYRPDELIALAAKAGYDLSGARTALDRLFPVQ